MRAVVTRVMCFSWIVLVAASGCTSPPPGPAKSTMVTTPAPTPQTSGDASAEKVRQVYAAFDPSQLAAEVTSRYSDSETILGPLVATGWVRGSGALRLNPIGKGTIAYYTALMCRGDHSGATPGPWRLDYVRAGRGLNAGVASDSCAPNTIQSLETPGTTQIGAADALRIDVPDQTEFAVVVFEIHKAGS